MNRTKTIPMNPTYDDVVKAQSMKGDDIRKTSLLHSPIFSQLTGSEVYLKSEFQDGVRLNPLN